MAVRDEVPRHIEGKDRPSGQAWREMLGHIPGVVLLGGLFMYAYLSICYDRFYGSLGVDPNDVGLTYAGTLARSSGFVITTLFIIAYCSSALIGALHGARYRRLHATDSPEMYRRLAAVSLVVVGGIAFYLSPPMVRASDAAREVRAGRPVAPVPFTFLFTPDLALPIPVLAIHADLVTVEPAGKPSDSPAAQRLQGKKLLYLGQSDGTVLLYDATVQRTIYVPASSMVLQVVNCRAEPPPDAACP
jgi:hypothetical protein